MRCKSCNSEMTEQDHVRKDIDGSFVDLCTVCWSASEAVLSEMHWLDEDDEDVPVAAPQRDLRRMFDAFVEKHNLMESWADGLGLKWTPEERQTHFYNKCYREFSDLMSIGYGTVASLERSCSIHKANRLHENSGASFAGDVPTDGYVSKGNLEPGSQPTY